MKFHVSPRNSEACAVNKLGALKSYDTWRILRILSLWESPSFNKDCSIFAQHIQASLDKIQLGEKANPRAKVLQVPPKHLERNQNSANTYHSTFQRPARNILNRWKKHLYALKAIHFQWAQRCCFRTTTASGNINFGYL